jgi:hypothetical protein
MMMDLDVSSSSLVVDDDDESAVVVVERVASFPLLEMSRFVVMVIWSGVVF